MEDINSEINKVEMNIAMSINQESNIDMTKKKRKKRKKEKIEEKIKEDTNDEKYQLHNRGKNLKEKYKYIEDEGLDLPMFSIMNRFHPKVRVKNKLVELKDITYQKFAILNSKGWCFEDVVSYFTYLYYKKKYWMDKNSRIQLIFTKEHEGLISQKGSGVTFYRSHLLKPDKFDIRYIEKKLFKDNKYNTPDFGDGDLMSIIVRKVKIPRGNGRNSENNSKNKISPPFEQYCGLACLVIHLQKINGELTYQNWLKKNRNKTPWVNRAKKLGKEINHEKSEMRIDDFNKFVNKYPEHCVCIMNENREVIFKSPNAKYVCYLWLKNDHYQYITKILSFMGYNHTKKGYAFCDYCIKMYIPRKGFNGHRCKDRESCNNYQCNYHYNNYDDELNHRKDKIDGKCVYCNCKLWYKECKRIHENICTKNVWFCDGCNKKVDLLRYQENKHKCGEYYCRICDIIVLPDTCHRCYLRKLKKQRNNNIEQYAFDIECVYDPETCRHEFSMLVLQKLYTNEEWVFHNIEEFHDFVNELTKKKKVSHFWAHNAKGYDSFIIFSIFKEVFNITPNKIIKQGQKIMMMRYGTVSFLDSMNHISGSLNNLITTFGLTINDKDYFPYRFYTLNNINYVGGIPDKKYFNCAKCKECCSYDKCSSNRKSLKNKKKLYIISGGTSVLDEDIMTEEMKEKAGSISNDLIYNIRNGETCKCIHFKEWYKDWVKNDYEYDIKEECLEYCKNDVSILRKALEYYRTMSIDITGIDPLKKITIASYAYEYYRYAHLKEKTIGLLNRTEYNFARRSLQGGRTNALGFYYKGLMRYIDVVSLYPSVQLNGVYPINHATIDNDPDLDETIKQINNDIVGFAEVDIIPPKNLYHPLLLVHKDGKLVENLMDEDFIKKVYTYCELKKALSLGYKIEHVYETHVYEKRNDLFKSYVDKLFELKNKFSKNKKVGKKAIVKMLLNSLWGKFGQKDINKKDEFLSRKKFFDVISKDVDVIDFEELSSDCIFIQYRDRESENLHLNNSNPAIASYTTSQARLILYEAMEKLGDRVLYHDTDSIIYRSDKSLIEETTDIGGWELEAELKEFVSIGAKSYAYKTNDNKVVVKSKGFNTEWVKFKDYKDIIDCAFSEDNIKKTKNYLDDFYMKRNKTGITNISLIKKLSYVYDKRDIDLEDMTRSYPKGYERKDFANVILQNVK